MLRFQADANLNQIPIQDSYSFRSISPLLLR